MSKPRSAADKLPMGQREGKNYVHEDRIHEVAVKYEMEKAKTWERDWGFLHEEFGGAPPKKTHDEYTEEELKKMKSATYAKESEKIGKLPAQGVNLEVFPNTEHRRKKMDLYNDRFDVEFDRQRNAKSGN